MDPGRFGNARKNGCQNFGTPPILRHVPEKLWPPAPLLRSLDVALWSIASFLKEFFSSMLYLRAEVIKTSFVRIFFRCFNKIFTINLVKYILLMKLGIVTLFRIHFPLFVSCLFSFVCGESKTKTK